MGWNSERRKCLQIYTEVTQVWIWASELASATISDPLVPGMFVATRYSAVPCEPSTYIDPHVAVTLPQVVQDAGLVQEGHVGHVADLVELRWVHLLDIILLHGEGLGS